ncbi:MAG: ATP-binding cassette domain-containing protein, partial [Thermodesulfobacteriota bacterium]|nr:ATP-binding cassette domain-containing protein [Thermodesulfobacteriota bacterium]
MSRLLRLDDVHCYRGHNYVLQGLSLDVMKGSVVAILGRNGMGKTSTMRCIMGFDRLSHGKIYFRKDDISHLAIY